MDRDELREKMVDWLSGDLTGLDRYLPEDKITYLINRQLSLLAPILADAEKWDRVKETHEFKFVRHIEAHLADTELVPVCKICGKTVFEIAIEGDCQC